MTPSGYRECVRDGGVYVCLQFLEHNHQLYQNKSSWIVARLICKKVIVWAQRFGNRAETPSRRTRSWELSLLTSSPSLCIDYVLVLHGGRSRAGPWEAVNRLSQDASVSLRLCVCFSPPREREESVWGERHRVWRWQSLQTSSDVPQTLTSSQTTQAGEKCVCACVTFDFSDQKSLNSALHVF